MSTKYVDLDGLSRFKTKLGTIPTKTSQLTNDSNFITRSSYATPWPSGDAGTIKTIANYGTDVTEGGYLKSQTKTASVYNSADNDMFISKGTLENVITNKDLTTKSYVDDKVENYKVLWTNPNWNTSFAEQDVTTLDDSDYEYIMIDFDGYAPYQNYGSFTSLKPSLTYSIPFSMCYYSGQPFIRHRFFSRISSTKYHFYGGAENASLANDRCVPLRIIGFNLPFKS